MIEQTIREKLPEGFQTAEYLKEHGMVDIVVERKNLKETVDHVLRLLMDARLKNLLNGKSGLKNLRRSESSAFLYAKSG